MTEYRYATLTDMEARYGIDFSAQDGYPSDAQIYHASNDCMIGRASVMINEYASTTFTSGGGTTTEANIREACCQLVGRMFMERHLLLGLTGAMSVSDEWGSMSFSAGDFELMTPEIRLLVDSQRARNAFPVRLTTG